jgi:PLP dependent protein
MKNKDKQLQVIKTNLKEITDNIDQATAKKGFSPEKIKLIAVTKTFSAEVIDLALEAGVGYIGESKVQEAEEKIPNLKRPFKEFHFIGHLQKNKINKLMELKPTLIHSIDSVSTAKKLNSYMLKKESIQDILVQINTSGEDSKYGLLSDIKKIEEFMREILTFTNIRVRGLMTISVLSDDDDKVRACFSGLRSIFDELNTKMFKGMEMDTLSMGMSDDYIIAVEEGSNMVRIGSAIFGARSYA